MCVGGGAGEDETIKCKKKSGETTKGEDGLRRNALLPFCMIIVQIDPCPDFSLHFLDLVGGPL